MADNGSKTEKASPKKRRDERKKGNIFKSQDIITVVSLIGCFYALKFLAPLILDTARSFMVRYIGYIGSLDDLNNDKMSEIGIQIMIASAKAAVPITLIAAALAILATGVQTRFLFTAKNLAPKLNRISPISGLKKLFSLKNVIELLKNILKITLLLVILFDFIRDRVDEVPQTMWMDLENSISYIVKEVMDLILSVSMWFAAIAAFDLLYQWWDYERQIKMSKQEVKEEYKQTEGNPEIKSRIRELQRQRARNRMMQEVPKADVIIRNPTHFAVALRYNPDTDAAPVLIAKGQDELALRIVKIGEENHVFILENKPLARAIYASTKLNQEIPPEFYGTIAEILVYIYKLNKKEPK